MPKYKVTKNMGSALKNLRQYRKIKAIDIARSIDKTGAYISKLEKGVLNTIEEEDLIIIINAMSKDEEEFNEALKTLLKDTTMEFSEEEAANEEWKLNLDRVFRQIPINEKYISIIKEKIHSLDITTQELSDYIYSNSDLYNDVNFSKELLDSSPYNKWIFNNGNSFIKMEVPSELINGIIDGKKTITNYDTLLIILITLFRLDKNSKEDSYKKAYNIFHELKIQTLSEKEELMQAYDQQKFTNNLLEQRDNKDLAPADIKLIQLLHDFNKHINSFAQGVDINYTNQKLSTLVNTLEEDPVLFMGYIGIDLSKLKDVDMQIKRDFTKAVSELVDEYSIRQPKEEKPELI